MREAQVPVERLGTEVDDLAIAVQREKKRRPVKGKRSVYTVGLRDQIKNCTVR